MLGDVGAADGAGAEGTLVFTGYFYVVDGLLHDFTEIQVGLVDRFF